MPLNKNALLRYKILDRCFSSGRNDYTIEKLLNTINSTLYDQGMLGISIRQLREDIKTMRDSTMYNAPIVARQYDGKKCYYTYSDADYSIFKSGISDEEFTALRSTIEMLGRYRSGNSWIEEIITNLECRFDVLPNNEKIVFFEDNKELTGIGFLGDIIKHAIAHEAIDVVYRSYRGHEEEYIFCPHCIKQYNGRWFMLGYEKKYGRFSNFAIDRIRSFKPSQHSFVENTTIDYETYFKDIVGVTVPEDSVPVQTVRLRFSSSRFPYVVSKPIHKSQRIVDAENGIIELSVRHNKELDQKIFSYIPDVEVLSPCEYREKIAVAIRKNLESYNI